MINVLIVARAPALRRGLRAMIESDSMRVVGEELAISNGYAHDHPAYDVLLVADPELIPERLHPGTSIVAVADEERLASRLSTTGAIGWAIVPSEISGELLRAAVIAVAQGMTMMPAARVSVAAVAHETDDDQDEEGDGVEEALTIREREVLEWLASGLTNREIAHRLAISEHTVKFHISTIYSKLGASSRTEAVRLAVRRGLLTL